MKKRASHPCVYAQILPYKRFYCNFLHNMLCFQKSRLNRRFSPEIRHPSPKTQYLQVLQSFLNKHSFLPQNRLQKRPVLFFKINLFLISKTAAPAFTSDALCILFISLIRTWFTQIAPWGRIFSYLFRESRTLRTNHIYKILSDRQEWHCSVTRNPAIFPYLLKYGVMIIPSSKYSCIIIVSRQSGQGWMKHRFVLDRP